MDTCLSREPAMSAPEADLSIGCGCTAGISMLTKGNRWWHPSQPVSYCTYAGVGWRFLNGPVSSGGHTQVPEGDGGRKRAWIKPQKWRASPQCCGTEVPKKMNEKGMKKKYIQKWGRWGVHMFSKKLHFCLELRFKVPWVQPSKWLPD